LLQIEVRSAPPAAQSPERDHQIERAVRAMGALGGEGPPAT
jgi:hypothetical protein